MKILPAKEYTVRCLNVVVRPYGGEAYVSVGGHVTVFPVGDCREDILNMGLRLEYQNLTDYQYVITRSALGMIAGGHT